MYRKNDILWKGMLEVIFDDLLRFIYPQADNIFDMQRGFDFLDKELSEMYLEPEKQAQTRYVDKLVKVHRKDGEEECLLIHVEVQGYHDPDFSRRMFKYYCRIFDRYDRAVTAIAIFSGRNKSTMSDCYKLNFLGTQLSYRYNTLRIIDYPDDLLQSSDNPFALVLLIAKKALQAGTDPERMEQKLLIARLLYKKGLTKRKIAAIFSFLNNYILFKKKQTYINFTKQLDQITAKTNSMDIFEQVAEMKAEEARKQERTKSSRLFVRNLLANTDFSIKKIASLANVSVDFVRKIKVRSGK